MTPTDHSRPADTRGPLMTTRTIRRYAHEIYPHAEDGQTRTLEAEVPYLYAGALGLDISGTGWSDAAPEVVGPRVARMGDYRHLALLADALLQGLAGQEAWEWADQRAWDETGEWTWERATHYGVPCDQIKPYPCGPEPENHEHLGQPDTHGRRAITFAQGRESECPDCTEEATA